MYRTQQTGHNAGQHCLLPVPLQTLQIVNERDDDPQAAAAAGTPPRLAPHLAQQQARHAVLTQVQAYIAAHLHQPSLAPADILAAFPLSRPTLYRLFEGSGGLATYIRRCRLHEAAQMLEGYPTRVIVEIAYFVGFGSASDFSRAFRRSYGVTPSVYRELRLREQELERSVQLAVALPDAFPNAFPVQAGGNI